MGQSKVLVSDKLSDAGVAALKAEPSLLVDYRPGLSHAELVDNIGQYDALVIRSASNVDAAVIEAGKSLKVIGRAGIGVDNVDVAAASRKGIVVMNTPTGNAVTTAEHALALLCSLARKIPQAAATMREGKWEKNRYQGRELAHKTLGIFGLGNIGRIVADRARGLKMQVIAFDPVISPERASSLGVELVSIDELLRRADFITIHTPLTPDTQGLINDAAFEKMKKGVLLVNAARGGIVDELALARAVEAGKVGGAALDVFEQEPIDPKHPLLKLENVICTPHLGASTAEAQERVAIEIAEQIVEYLRDGQIRNAVNVPTYSAEVAEKIAPYLKLARKLGVLVGQLEPIEVSEVRVTCTGLPGELGTRPIAYAALAGYLERHVEHAVQPIQAPFEAESRGIALIEVRDPSSPRGYAHSVSIEIRGQRGSHRATGSVGVHGEARLVALDGFAVETTLEGAILMLRNQDRPGVIGAVGTLLGTKQINVSSLQVGLDAETRDAIALWSVDSPVPAETLAELRKLDKIRSVRYVELG